MESLPDLFVPVILLYEGHGGPAAMTIVSCGCCQVTLAMACGSSLRKSPRCSMLGNSLEVKSQHSLSTSQGRWVFMVAPSE